MPLDDAITLLQKEYDTYMALDRVPPIVAAPAAIADENTEEDHTFLAPSRNMVTLLRMLADSRILSIGELDEIAAFVQERKRRLEGRRLDNKSADTRNGTTSDLKSRILSMLYPPTSNSSTASVNAVGQLTSTPSQSSSIPNSTLDANNLQTINRLAGALPNPAIQQALDTLMMLPPGQFPQPVPAPTSASTGLSATASAQSQQQSYGKNSAVNMPQERNSGTMAGPNRMSYGSGPGSVKTGRADINPMQQRMDDFTRYGSQRPAGDYSAANNTPSGFSTYKQPTQQPMYLNDVKTAQDSRGPVGGLNRRESDEHYQGARNPGSAALRSKDDSYGGPNEDEPPAPTAPSWQRRKRGKRGGTKSNAGNRNASDLSSSSMGPIGTLPDPYPYSWPPGSSSELGAQYPPAAGPHMINDQYPYPNQSYGYNYPPQSYY
ncbi:unnamed protein product [Echinostoma caproni]|uniref:Chromatin modification-related protein eaf-1 n=1 Tax=Echinostoma caproni TaxID=27848 RepID=A0A183AWB1_9TREM|nr:unnamed protein product [Echinostoma caproni]